MHCLHVLGGGLPIGSVLLIKEDKFTGYAKLLLKYFISQGIASENELLVVGDGVENMCDGLMWLSEDKDGDDKEKSTSKENEDDRMAIAWRYKKLGKFESGIPTGRGIPSMTLSKQLSKTDASRPFCNTFDLTRTIPEAIVRDASLSLLDINDIIKGSGDTRLYDQILQKIRTMVKEKGLSNIEASNAREQVNTLRIGIESIDSPGWPPQRPGEVFKFFHALRGLLRSSNAAAVITISAHLYSDDSQDVVRRIEHMSDAVIELDSFAARPETADTPYCQDYHGLFYVHKLPVINSLLSPSTKLSILLGSGHSNLGFKLRRKKFSIETFHLPPEGGVSERRTGPDKQKGTGETESKIAGKVTSVGCGSLPGKTDLYEF